MRYLIRLPLVISMMIWLAACASNPQTPSLDRIAQPAASTQISPQLLQEELDFIVEQLIAVHPEPFARSSEEAFLSMVETTRRQLLHPMSRGEFYLRIAPLLVSLNDVHSFIQLPKDRSGDARYKGERLFPLAVILNDNKLYAAADLAGQNRVQPGTEIYSINGQPVPYLLERMRTLVAHETLSGQNRRIQMDFAWLLASLGVGEASFLLELVGENEIYSRLLSGILLAKSDLNNVESAPLSYYGYNQLSAKTGLLWLNDFNESPEIFSEFLADKFSLMEKQGVTNLILDLRYNSGGLSQNLKSLLARLTDKPVYWARSGRLKVSKPLQANHQTKTRERRQSKYFWGLQWLPVEWTNQLQYEIWWAEPGENLDLVFSPVEPNKNNALERVWVLTNGFCYSACSTLVAAVNYYQLGITMGETPGSLANWQFAYPVAIELPHSRLKMTLPTMKLVFNAEASADLISPVWPLTRTAKDIATRQDPLLNRALREAEKP